MNKVSVSDQTARALAEAFTPAEIFMLISGLGLFLVTIREPEKVIDQTQERSKELLDLLVKLLSTFEGDSYTRALEFLDNAYGIVLEIEKVGDIKEMGEEIVRH